MPRIQALAPEPTILAASPDPQNVFCYTPGLERLASGRLIATMDYGMKADHELDGPLFRRGESGMSWQCQARVSDDGGATWRLTGRFPMLHARPFAAGGSLYILGQARDLQVVRSDDDGETWSHPVALSDSQHWHQSACNVHYANGCVYLVMERRCRDTIRGWPVGDFAPVLMRAPVDADLTRRESWTFASELPFYEAVDESKLDYFGVPWYAADPVQGVMAAPGRHCAPMGWLESNVVQFTDPSHLWHDPSGRTLHIWARAHTGHVGYAAIARVVEQGDRPGTGPMVTELQTAPSGRRVLYVPCPGGQMRFHVLHDAASERFWLLSTQAVDSMCRADAMPPGRYNLPNNERRRLQLHVSRDMVSWCFAGLVDMGGSEVASRHYASMIPDGDDLLVLSRSGTDHAKTAHDGDIITYHRIPDFRDLVY